MICQYSIHNRTAALQWLLQQLATLKLKTGDAEAALQLYKQLHGLTGTTAGGLRVLSRLACVLALRQPQAVEELQRSLPELRVDMDSTALEQECLGMQRGSAVCFFALAPVCTCMYLCVPVCTCVYLCAPVCTCVYLCAPVCTCVYLCAPVCTCVYLCVFVCICVHLCAPVCTCVYVCICVLCHSTVHPSVDHVSPQHSGRHSAHGC